MSGTVAQFVRGQHKFMGKGYPCLSTAAGCSGVLAQDTAVYYHSGGKAQAKLGYGQVGRLSHSTGTKEPEQVLRIIILSSLVSGYYSALLHTTAGSLSMPLQSPHWWLHGWLAEVHGA